MLGQEESELLQGNRSKRERAKVAIQRPSKKEQRIAQLPVRKKHGKMAVIEVVINVFWH